MPRAVSFGAGFAGIMRPDIEAMKGYEPAG